MFGRDAEHHTRGRVCSPDSRDRAVSRLAEPFAQAGLLRAAKGSLTLRACRKFSGEHARPGCRSSASRRRNL